MHYNPTSIKQVEDTIDDLAQRGVLGSVVVESCEVRWNTTMEILNTPRGQLLKPVLTSEMKAASDRAVSYNRPADLSSPLNGGWGRFYNDVKEAVDVALPTGPGYLTPRSFFDPRLLIAAPVSFAKYPLSFLARNPISTAAVLSIMFALTTLDTGSAFADATLQEQVLSIVESLAFAGLEFALLGRVMIQVLLAERNVVLARNILHQCEIYSTSRDSGGDDKGPWSKLLDALSPSSTMFNTEKGLDRIVGKDDTFYLPRSITATSSIDQQGSVGSNDNGEDKIVVAVLGMAHCNGIQKLLREQLV
eukprot:CAMPEP_0178598988 /NCGR_PEP_ID=MMETSP0697-20121206/33061_1 /TAXON_ID=265572 /ORGANISM="Extubocellulus spinifer, Strain CCMP396" /LENGTH=304 /DNA_ID=CAMNT_0020236843 /DNA_START=213 /DNA_END=1128 /DNA_ORIENTATION=+